MEESKHFNHKQFKLTRCGAEQLANKFLDIERTVFEKSFIVAV